MWGLIVGAQGSVAEIPLYENLSVEARSEWQRLLHFQSAKGRSRVKCDQFFLDPDGTTSPEKEYRRTFQAMFLASTDEQTKTQCKYLARRDFFLRHWSEGKPKAALISCRFSDDWLRRLNADHVTIVFASAYLNSAASGFGHTFLKLGNANGAVGMGLLDYGINFAARTQDTDGALYALYGLLGYFPGSFAMLPYHQMIKEYTHLEGRDLWEYEIDLNPTETQRILFHLLELEGSYFDYYFLDDNCSYALLDLLQIGRPGLQLVKEEEPFVIPLDTVKRLMRKQLVTKIHYRPSLETEWQFRRSHLKKEQISAVRKAVSGQDSGWKLDTESLDAALAYLALKPEEKILSYRLNKERALRNDGQDIAVPRPERSPDLSHDSSSLSLGFYRQFVQAKFQPAFHDFLSADQESSRNSHMEVFSLTLNSGKSLLQEVKFLKLVSTKPWTEFAFPFSWGVDVGSVADAWMETRHRPYFITSGGLRYDFQQGKLSLQAWLSPFVRKSLDEDYLIGAGSSVQLLVRFSADLRSLLEYQILPSFAGSSLSYGRISAVENFGVQDELRFSLTEVHEAPRPDHEHWVEGGLHWVHSFSL